MALEIRRGPQQGLVADRRLYLTRDGGNVDGKPGQRVVEEGDRDAAWLFATPGSVIPADEVARLGLELVDGKIAQKSAAKPVAEPEPVPEPKAAEPAADPQPAAEPPKPSSRARGR